jgi:hypothetical protein
MLTNKKLREAVKKDTEAILLSRGVPTDLAKKLAESSARADAECICSVSAVSNCCNSVPKKETIE